jgi:hypothetical protein
MIECGEARFEVAGKQRLTAAIVHVIRSCRP